MTLRFDRQRLGFLWAALACLGTLSGCRHHPPGEHDAPQPQVSISLPLSREVSDYAEFTGRTSAVESVDVRARVSGYLQKINFEAGADVEQGAVLFEIDPRPYAAEVERARARLRVNEANLTRRLADLTRNKPLAEDGTIPAQEWDEYVAAHAEADAAVKAAQAEVDFHQLDLDFTQVLAPISGRTSKYNITVGNLVTADATLLTTVVSQDPMYAYFDVDERTLLRVRRLVREGKHQRIRDAQVPIWLALADEQGFPHEGTLDFADNQIETSTGTVTVRGRFPNSDELLAPGMFVRVRVNIGQPHKALLVSERALGSDQGQRFLLVLGKDDTVEYRRVGVGMLHEGLRVIETGLSAKDRVIVSGLQHVRPGQRVQAKVVRMPGATKAAGQAARRSSRSARLAGAVAPER